MEAPRACLQIDLLGGFRVVAGKPVEESAWRLRKARSLLKLLALEPSHRLPREVVLDLLWPDLEPDAAANNLYQTIHALRRALGGSRSAPLVVLEGSAVFLDPAVSVRTDVEAFERATEAAREGGRTDLYQHAASLYSGDLLPDDLYEDWAAARREYLRERYLTLLLELAHMQEDSSQTDRAVETLQRVIALDAAREEAHASLMRLLASQGRRHQALRQYTVLREALWNELGVDPDRETERLYAEILSGGFGLEAPPPPLPVPLTSFIGREEETRAVRDLLDQHRLLTLLGAGGAGKTRLVLAAVQGMTPVYFAELAALTDRRDLPNTVLAACRLQTKDDPLTALAEGLGARLAVLVLDNCEHLAPAPAELAAALLARCPGLRVVTTSREPLYASGEALFRVPPLQLPPAGAAPEGILQSEAGRLFVERARARIRDFRLDKATAGAVAEICRRLDGLPLAIELAAARVPALPAVQIAARLDDALTLLTAGDRTEHPRHRALRATLDWSVSLLSAQEQAVLRRLGVFLGGFALAEAEAVCADLVDPRRLLDLLAQLVDRSLLTAAATAEEARFYLAEPVRQYAHTLLEDAGELEMARSRHAEAYLALAQRARPELRGPRQREWNERLSVDHDNLRAALGWLIDTGDVQRATELAGSLWRFWHVSGRLADGVRWLEAVREMAGTATPEAHARMLAGLTALIYRLGDLARAAALSQEALDYVRANGTPRELAVALNNHGVLVLELRSIDEAVAIFDESLALHRSLGDGSGTRLSLRNLGYAYNEQGRYDHALRCYQEVLALRRAAGDTWGVADALVSLALTRLGMGDPTGAITLLEEGLALHEQLQDRSGMAEALNSLGAALLDANRLEEAGTALDRAMALFCETGETRGQVRVIVYQAQLALVADDRHTAFRLSQQVIGRCLAHSYRSALVQPLLVLARLSDTPETAARLLGAAEGLLACRGHPSGSWVPNAIRGLNETLPDVLGAEHLASLRLEGGALSEDDAVALALSVPAPR